MEAMPEVQRFGRPEAEPVIEPMVCPGCGAPEMAYHERGCELRPEGVTECCSTPIWPGFPPEHTPYCPAGWGSVGPDVHHSVREPMGDPWHDVQWSPEANAAHLNRRIGP